MTFAGAESPDGAPLKNRIVPMTNMTTWTSPPRAAQRATLRGWPTATACSMDPSLWNAGAYARRLTPRFSLNSGSPAPVMPRARRLQLTPQLGLPGEKQQPEGNPGQGALSTSRAPVLACDVEFRLQTRRY